MTSTTRAVMKACEREARVTVSLRDDGDLDVAIESDCDVVMGYAERLGGRITAMDVYGFQQSRINSDEVRGNLTPTCLVPNAIYNAAFLELGMMTRSLAEKAGENIVELVERGGHRFILGRGYPRTWRTSAKHWHPWTAQRWRSRAAATHRSCCTSASGPGSTSARTPSRRSSSPSGRRRGRWRSARSAASSWR
ncbi:MAG: hypothetical protein II933_02020 [Candidatus Methanomethylophilaceae archaeon]|nr:hypothetical protein [Candidatus Methanomethylophilaceae archaeon]